MKILVALARLIVGALFIFSGFVKLNDPIGFAFKLEEYFSPSVLNLEFLSPYSLVIAVVLVIFELVVGIMLLIGYRPKFTTWALLLMIIFGQIIGAGSYANGSFYLLVPLLVAANTLAPRLFAVTHHRERPALGPRQGVGGDGACGGGTPRATAGR